MCYTDDKKTALVWRLLFYADGLFCWIIVYTITGMKIEYDSVKDQINQVKHGVSLAMATRLEWAWLWATEDRRRDYGETRMIGYAPIGSRVYCVVYTDREGVRRIISLRKANKREVKRYASIV